MGACLSNETSERKETATSKATESTDPNSKMTIEADDDHVYVLKKKRPGCTGMFWRKDPSGATSLAGNSDWPRDNAELKGSVKSFDGKLWLASTHVKQAGKLSFVNAPSGAFMPFEYDNHYYLEKKH
jgi:hypothetical protein|uniref:Uncharacterized protein n=1 Tax=Attheya septentrionalis TaxID=420275 RepID=A0A7S2UQ10_9STRA|mmetsp:Transcript_7844/g.14141  ORF Transcript_7844/g.14141 Transcript_7844/m.14141 type:complete len:127 (+) Transcript_7844:142-522(+)